MATRAEKLALLKAARSKGAAVKEKEEPRPLGRRRCLCPAPVKPPLKPPKKAAPPRALITYPVDVVVADICYPRLRDTLNAAPAVKAVIDGLTDYGLWPDDDPRYVRRIIMLPPRARGGRQADIRHRKERNSMNPCKVWSYGGGVQSVAIACMVAAGRIDPPDITVIADTGYEAETTWSYLADHVAPLLAPHGVIVERAPHTLAKVDLINDDRKILIPVITTKTATGKQGRLPQYCSTEWKTRVVRRWLRARGVQSCEMWLGFSVDEIERCKPSGLKWITNTHPLIALGVDRNGCHDIIKAAGLPPAPKSSCYMCPWRGPAERAALTPADMERARAIERRLQEHDPYVRLWKGDASGGGAPESWDAATEHCDSGAGCWT